MKQQKLKEDDVDEFYLKDYEDHFICFSCGDLVHIVWPVKEVHKQRCICIHCFRLYAPNSISDSSFKENCVEEEPRA
jgi:hypothetical protein